MEIWPVIFYKLSFWFHERMMSQVFCTTPKIYSPFRQGIVHNDETKHCLWTINFSVLLRQRTKRRRDRLTVPTCQNKEYRAFDIWGSHTFADEEFELLGYNTVSLVWRWLFTGGCRLYVQGSPRELIYNLLKLAVLEEYKVEGQQYGSQGRN
jgi:hypothetical protein